MGLNKCDDCFPRPRGSPTRISVAGQWVQTAVPLNRRLEMGKLIPPGFGFHSTPFLVLSWGLWVLSVVTQVERCSKMALSAVLDSDSHCFPAFICNQPMISVYSGYRPCLVLGVRNTHESTKSGKLQNWENHQLFLCCLCQGVGSEAGPNLGNLRGKLFWLVFSTSLL